MGARFCPATGKILPGQKFCSICGQKVQLDWRICPYCGKSLLDIAFEEKKLPAQVLKETKKKSKLVLWISTAFLSVICIAISGFFLLRLFPDFTPQPVKKETRSGVSHASKSILKLPVLRGTPVPQPTTKISTENANKVVLLTRWWQGVVSELAFSPDGKMLAVATSYGIYLYDSMTLVETFHIGKGYAINSVAFSPVDNILASACGDNTIRLWSVSDGRLLHTFTGHTDFINSVIFSPDGQILASSSRDKTIRLWNITERKLTQTIAEHQNTVYSIAFSPDGKTIASGSYDNTIRLWQVSYGSFLHTFEEKTNYISSLAFAPDGETLASSSWPNIIYIWRTSDGRLIHTLEGHNCSISKVVFSTDGQILISGSLDNYIKIWHMVDGELLASLGGQTSGVSNIAFSPLGNVFASATTDGIISIWGVYP
jgi:WD40 repeat protein